MSLSRRQRPRFRPAVDRLEVRTSPVAIQPTVLEQVFFERINDYRATLQGVNSRPFALLPALDPFAVQATRTRNVNAFKNALDRAHIPWDRRYSFTSGEFSSISAAPIGSDPASIDAEANQLVTTARSAASFVGAWPLLGHPKNALYRQHRIAGISIATSGRQASVRDISVAYRGNAPLVTGVVYRDANHNGQYDAGEGIPGVTISAGTLGSTAAWDTGGFTLPVHVKKPATITVEASGGGLPAPISETVAVRPGVNSRLNFVVA
ncbi:MAG: hypothetical protein ACYC61_11040 [Isosphaeraceae bacterium]